jgi:ABC-2 type transport system ATP-binding protein
VRAIRCAGLTKILGGRPVVDHLDLQVDEGAIFGFLGPNGAGKTTTIRLLLGLSKATSGSAEVLGETVPVPPPVLAQVGAMVEEPGFYPWMSGRNFLEVMLRTGPPSEKAQIDDALELAGLTDAAHRRIKTYSQGMRQRLGLAVALLRRPRLLILDEPANGLDPAGLRDLRALLRRLSKEGTTIFLSSHQLHEVEQLCHRIAIIHQGRVVLEGDPSELATSGTRIRIVIPPAHMDDALLALCDFTPTVIESGTISVVGINGQMANALLQQRGILAESIGAEGMSLEEQFFRATQDDHS